MKDRIRQIIEWTNLSQQDFATRLGISPASLSSIFTGRTNPTNNHVQAIHRAFPEINVSWLLFGEGKMMNADGGEEKNLLLDDSVQVSGDSNFSNESSSMASIFSDEDYGAAPVADPSSRSVVNGRREISGARPTGFHFVDNAKKNDIKERRIKEIRVFFDDGTYEAFVPSGGK